MRILRIGDDDNDNDRNKRHLRMQRETCAFDSRSIGVDVDETVFRERKMCPVWLRLVPPNCEVMNYTGVACIVSVSYCIVSN